MPDGITTQAVSDPSGRGLLDLIDFRDALKVGILDFPPKLTFDEWTEAGELIGALHRGVGWLIGTWWLYGPWNETDRVSKVKQAGWKGPALSTCQNAATCCKKFPMPRRLGELTYSHHYEVRNLPEDQADAMLRWCLETPEPRSVRELAAKVKQVTRAIREVDLADRIEAESERLGVQHYGVIYADPPWRFEPYSRESGMDRAADNHYPTMTPNDLAALELPAAEDCALFLWATVAMLPDAMAFLSDHGFAYRSAYGWLKPGPGTGYWSQSDQLELLLVGIRGDVPAPAPGTQPPQIQTFPRTRHSQKPDAFADMIEAMFPNVAKLEMFARTARPGWDRWGAESEYAESNR